MKATVLTRTAGACFAMAAMLAIPSFAQAEQKIGKTLDEIIELAKQEPTVTFATTWEGEIIDFEKKGFKEKYGLDFEFVFVEGVEFREKIFNEALAGVNEVDLVNMSTELQDKFIEAKLVVPVDYENLFPKINKANIRPGGHYLATGWNQFVIAYNTTLVSEADAPKDWQRLPRPQMEGEDRHLYAAAALHPDLLQVGQGRGDQVPHGHQGPGAGLDVEHQLVGRAPCRG